VGKEGATSVRPLASWKSFHLDASNIQNSEKPQIDRILKSSEDLVQRASESCRWQVLQDAIDFALSQIWVVWHLGHLTQL